jgi:aconitate hydratase
MMGVLPLEFQEGANYQSLGLTGEEFFDLPLHNDLEPGQTLEVTATSADGTVTTFGTTVRLDTPVDVTYWRNGGILHTVLRELAAS